MNNAENGQKKKVVVGERTDGAISVNLLSQPTEKDINLARHDGGTCYQATVPEIGDQKIDAEKALFKPGHHTTFEHSFRCTLINKISVSDVTFGLHLGHPFYNTGQRSGRFCGNMFKDPKYKESVKEYINTYWPELSFTKVMRILSYVETGVEMYNSKMSEAVATALKFILKERPNLPNETEEQKKNLLKLAEKIAQEQMRMFISTIFPTALDHSVDLITAVSMWECAWSPALRSVTDMWKEIILEKSPELSFMFNPERRYKRDWSPVFETVKDSDTGIKYKPEYNLLDSDVDGFVLPDPKDMHHVDRLQFMPEYMDNSCKRIKARIHVSIATMGQDQRHRTIKRSTPKFTGHVYCPPILAELGLGEELLKYLKLWEKISSDLPANLKTILAPYGAMVTYEKSGDLNAIFHEMAKRLCWSAQEEIYHLGLLMKFSFKNSKIFSFFESPCFRTGKCGEGARCCGRDLSLRNDESKFFVERKI